MCLFVLRIFRNFSKQLFLRMFCKAKRFFTYDVTMGEKGKFCHILTSFKFLIKVCCFFLTRWEGGVKFVCF